VLLESQITLSGVLIILLFAGTRLDGRRSLDDLIAAAAFFAYLVVGAWILKNITSLTPTTLDPRLLSLDVALRFNPLELTHWTAARPEIYRALFVAYCLISPLMAIVWGIEQEPRLAKALALAGSFCFLCYRILPAVGPAVYHWSRNQAGGSPRNCVPSMHMAIALLLCANARRPSLRAVTCIYAFIVVVSSLAIGEHYLVDLLAAVPYAAAAQWIAGRDRPPAQRWKEHTI